MNKRLGILVASTSLMLNACSPPLPKCEDYKKHYLGKEANMVIQSNCCFGREIDLHGYNPVTKKPATYNATEGFYIQVKNSIELGDTLFKDKSATWFLLKKKRINIKFEMKCDGESYLESKPDTLAKTSKPI